MTETSAHSDCPSQRQAWHGRYLGEKTAQDSACEGGSRGIWHLRHYRSNRGRDDAESQGNNRMEDPHARRSQEHGHDACVVTLTGTVAHSPDFLLYLLKSRKLCLSAGPIASRQSTVNFGIVGFGCGSGMAPLEPALFDCRGAKLSSTRWRRRGHSVRECRLDSRSDLDSYLIIQTPNKPSATLRAGNVNLHHVCMIWEKGTLSLGRDGRGSSVDK